MRLFSLEWKKLNKKPYLYGSLGLTLFSMFIATLFAFLPEEEIQNVNMIYDWRFLIAITTAVTLFSFAVLAAVINAKVLLEEYIGKRVLLLFSYPIKRERLFGVKAVIAWGIPAVGALLANAVAIFAVGIVSNLFHVVPKQFGGKECVMVLLYSIVVGITVGNIGLISLWFGFWKSSVAASIVSALIISIPITNLFQVASGGIILIVIFFIITVISLMVFRNLKQRIKTMEVA